ncbi:single-stranded DNA-binding protein [Lacticaseibacillus mingshuiensis]|uniref:Single-stranded DNA-binding protein n=1 Tax=Lacticaseibacillus mingshuiensis TaxID=2799574 RepID=A0ABW4CL15_9LACO|nr:single-stranded DNA-binding protein [Lacticaseibacillus mingshuiensis]
MTNVVALTGRLTRNPELKYTQSGAAVATFTLAVDRNYLNAQGKRETDFINCVIWKKAAENLANYINKGSLVGVNGSVQTRSYDDKDGKRVYVTEVNVDNVTFLDTKKDTPEANGGAYSTSNTGSGSITPTSANASNAANHGANTAATNPFPDSGGPIDISDDDLPF